MDFLIIILEIVLPIPFLFLAYIFVKQFYQLTKFGINSTGTVIDYELRHSRNGQSTYPSVSSYSKQTDENNNVISMTVTQDVNNTAIPTIKFVYNGETYIMKSTWSESKLYLKFPIGSEIPITINTKTPEKSIYGSPISPSRILILIFVLLVPGAFSIFIEIIAVINLIQKLQG